MKIKVGAIRWDAWYGHDGKEDSVITQVERTLSPAEYHHRAPFFAEITPDGKITVPEYTQEIFDREMQYAIDAGIDYFSFLWYYDGMKTARQMFQKSKLNSKIQMCIILGGRILPSGLDELMNLFKQDYYVHVENGRPLIYYFGAYAHVKESIASLKEECAKRGIPAPYSVVMNLGEEDTLNTGADAIGQYGVGAVGGIPFKELCKNAEALWDKFSKTGMQFVPTVSCGWHNVPRYENPVKWLKVSTDQSYAQYPTGDELYSHLKSAYEYLDREDIKPKTEIRTVSMYAWNEHDEGGWICPTLAVDENGNQLYNPDGTKKINTEHLDGIARAIKEYKEK